MGFDLGGIEAPYLLAEAMMGLVEDVSFAMIENHAHAPPPSRSVISVPVISEIGRAHV